MVNIMKARTLILPPLILVVLVAMPAAYLLWGTATAPPPPASWTPKYEAVLANYERGTASWYGHPFHGRQTASGEIYDMYRLTVAHPSLPLGTRVRVKNLKNGKSVRLRVNDRGPYAEWKGVVYYRGQRAIDLSYAAAVELDMAEDGLAPVEIAVFNDTP
jgi:rare lipoprotein A